MRAEAEVSFSDHRFSASRATDIPDCGVLGWGGIFSRTPGLYHWTPVRPPSPVVTTKSVPICL